MGYGRSQSRGRTDRAHRRKSGRDARFGERSKRVSRRKERDTFRQVVMPAVFLFGAVGFLGLLGAVVHFALTDSVALHFVGMSLSLIALPFLLGAYGLVRGHHSSSLNEP